MSRLTPLSEIPTNAARRTEAEARRSYAHRGGRAVALQDAQWKIVAAPGCHGQPANDPPCYGWLLTEGAARAIEAQPTHMPDGSSHRRTRAVRAGGEA